MKKKKYSQRKIKKLYFFVKLINFAMNDKWNVFLTLSIETLIYFLITKDYYVVILLEVLFFILAFTTKRIGKMFIYLPISKTLSMNLKDVYMFKNYNYNNEKDKEVIKNIFKEECVKSLIESKIKRCTFSSHKWMLENVFKDKRVLNKYDLLYKESGKSNHILDILILSCGKETNNMYYKKQDYKIILKQKKLC